MTSMKKNASDSFLARTWRHPENRGVLISITLVIIEIIVFALLKDTFLRARNLRNIMRQTAELGLITIPIALVMITGNIDQSVGAIMGFTATAMGMMMKYMGFGIVPTVLIGIAIGMLSGAINGALVAYMKLPGIVVTVGSNTMFRGLCYVLNNARPIGGYDQSFLELSKGYIGDIVPASFLVMVLLFVAAIIFVERTKYGMFIYAVGRNQNAARFSGINVERIYFLTFVFCGLMAAVAGMVMLARVGSAEPTFAEGFQTQVMCVALIGGFKIGEGKGRLIGAAAGLLFVSLLNNGMNMLGIASQVQDIILGAIIVICCANIVRKSR